VVIRPAAKTAVSQARTSAHASPAVKTGKLNECHADEEENPGRVFLYSIYSNGCKELSVSGSHCRLHLSLLKSGMNIFHGRFPRLNNGGG
jgi:hypothetical protein